MQIDSLVSDKELIQKTLSARKKAYAPYSQYLVGAILVTQSGNTYHGCNIENASYGLTICAERVALFKAITEGERHFTAIFIATKDGGRPCGACRQVLNEFGPDMRIVCVDELGNIQSDTTLDILLPEAFGPKNL